MAKRMLLVFATLGQALFQDLPIAFNASPSRWAHYSYSEPGVAVLPGKFNRSIFDAPCASETTDETLTQANQLLNKTDFVAYDPRFFDIIGPNAEVKHVQTLTYQTHEAPCYIAKTRRLFFVEWGPPGGEDGSHSWQYLLDVETNELHNITTNPPTSNIHGCVVFQDNLYVVTDGSQNETGALIKVDPETLERKVLLNNYYQQPFMGFNDLEIDSEGNFWLTDSKAGWGRDIIPFTPPTNPTVYMVNGTTMRPRAVHITTGNANGVAIGETGSKRTVYLPDTGASESKPVSRKNPYGNRGLFAYDASQTGGTLTQGHLLNNPITYFYDGIRVSRSGLIFAGAGDGVDVIDPDSGLTLGSIRVGGGENLAVSLAFGENELWIVGRGGVWHVTGIQGRLARAW